MMLSRSGKSLVECIEIIWCSDVLGIERPSWEMSFAVELYEGCLRTDNCSTSACLSIYEELLQLNLYQKGSQSIL